MGWTLIEFHGHASLSRHNSEHDKIDNALWNDFITRVRAIAAEVKYERILLDFNGALTTENGCEV